MPGRTPKVVLAAVFALFGAPAIHAETSAVDDIELNTLAGSYLAGRAADSDHDLASAARFYAAALESDPGNPLLLENAVMLFLATGAYEEALTHAAQLAAQVPASAFARISLAVDAMQNGNRELASDHLSRVGPSALASLTAGLLQAWVQFDGGDIDGAVDTIADLRGPSWYDIFQNYHTAVLLDAAGRSEEAVDYARRAVDSDASAIGIIDGYARILARAGLRQDALAAVTDFAGELPLHPTPRSLLATLRSGLTPEPVAANALEGAAAVLYGLGSAIGGDDGPELPAAYLRLALYLDPESHVSAMAIGDVLQDADRCEEAVAVYDSVPDSHPLRRNADIQIGNCLYDLDQADEAAAALRSVVDANAADYEAAMQLGTVYRLNGEYDAAIEAYTGGLSHLPEEAPGLWRILYYRGIAYERSKQWPLAEADFKAALELNPEQPNVLNYLGYSWVDMGENLEEALDMIRTAVDLRPNDGFIVDSLGWAYYQLGRYEEAVRELERAVELQPEDPILNDHLGDALWQVGRKREAIFQWSHARDLEPDETDLPRILAKIEGGLVPGEDASAAASVE